MSTVFQEKEWIQLPVTPSFQYNNLSHDKKGKFCYIHLSEIVIVKKDSLTIQLPIPKAELYYASFITVSDNEYIAVASNVEFQLWSIDASAMLFSYAIDDSMSDNPFFVALQMEEKSHGFQLVIVMVILLCLMHLL